MEIIRTMIKAIPLDPPLREVEDSKLDEGEWTLLRAGPFNDFAGGATIRLNSAEELNMVKRRLAGAAVRIGGARLGVEVSDAATLAEEANNSARRGAARARPPAHR